MNPFENLTTEELVAIAKPITENIARNCNVAPQLVFPYLYLGLKELFATRCEVPPVGWSCTRDKGHEGPCAALENAL